MSAITIQASKLLVELERAVKELRLEPTSTVTIEVQNGTLSVTPVSVGLIPAELDRIAADLDVRYGSVFKSLAS